MATVVWDDALEIRIAETLARRITTDVQAYGNAPNGFERNTARLVLTILAECGLIERKQEHGTDHSHG